MAVFLFGHLRQLGARGCAIHACATICLIRTVTWLRRGTCGVHAVLFPPLGSWEIDLERAPKRFCVAQEFQEHGVIFCATPNEVHSFPACGTKLDILTTIVESASILVSPEVVQLSDYDLLV